MTIPFGAPPALLSRRLMLVGVTASLVSGLARAADVPRLKVGLLPFGTVQWEIEALTHAGLDTAEGIRIEIVPLASTDAARIAFLSGSVDTIVQDLLFAARLKAEGRAIVFLPQSSTEGELIVPPTSPIQTIADLAGRVIGVAGGPLDKNWLLLRAAARKQAQLDLTKAATVQFGAAPLLAAKLESGELDCGLLYWSQAARLEAKRYRSISSTEDVLKSLGVRGQVAVGGYLFRGDTTPAVIKSFRTALRAAERLLLDKPESWTSVRPLMKAPDDRTFEALKAAYVRGIPRKSRAEEIADARVFVSILKRVGGDELLGPVSDLPASLYVDPDIYG